MDQSGTPPAFTLRPALPAEAALATAIDDDACSLYTEAGLVIVESTHAPFFAHEVAQWTQAAREDYFRWFNQAETYRGGNTFASSLRRAKGNALELLSDSEKEALKPVLEAKIEKKSPRDVLSARNFSREWKVDELVPIVERGLKGGRNFERGRQLYGAVACAACHRFVNEGGSVGPELTGVVGRFSVHDTPDVAAVGFDDCEALHVVSPVAGLHRAAHEQ